MSVFYSRRLLWAALGVVIVGGIFWSVNSGKQGAVSLRSGEAMAPDISTPDGFLNTEAVSLAELTGKNVVLLDFWTYSCINCQRTLPYLNAWYDKYRDQGLEIIGVHTPEFAFEKSYENVRDAVERFGIKYPVVLDNDFSTWTAYGNNYWPRKYLIDINGRIVYDRIGEGGYEETERRIQQLLAERAQALDDDVRISVDVSEPSEAVTNMLPSRSPEIYFGASYNDAFGNGQPNKLYASTFTLPQTYGDDLFYLKGDWDVQREYVQNTGAGSIVFRYRAMNVYMVAASAEGVEIQILRDGVPLTSANDGADADNGRVYIQDERLYHVLSEPEGSEHVLEVRAATPGLQAFTFTFG